MHKYKFCNFSVYSWLIGTFTKQTITLLSRYNQQKYLVLASLQYCNKYPTIYFMILAYQV